MITVKNLTKRFDDKKVIDNLSMELKEGSLTTIMGTSGCGKTTFAMLLLGLMKPDSGTIEGLHGKRIAAVFQEDRLIEHLSAIENVKLVIDGKPDEEEIRRHLADVGLEGILAEKPTAQLSGGQKRRRGQCQGKYAKSDFICWTTLKGLIKNEGKSRILKKNYKWETAADYHDIET